MTMRAMPRVWVLGLVAGALLVPGPAEAAKCPPGSLAEVVVGIDLSGPRTIEQVTSGLPVTVERPLVRSRGIWEVRSTDPDYCGTQSAARKLAKKIEKDDAVRYAEAGYLAQVADDRFHAWASDAASEPTADARAWTDQPVVGSLGLAVAHGRSQGAGSVVAVLDTGVSRTHPALSGSLLPGWDYVDDDASPEETRNGLDDDLDGLADESFGHGTFLSGLVLLVAPRARVLPMRVLDSDGRGNTFVVAQAVADAVTAGADVISLSFGTTVKPESTVLEDALKQARKAGVVVVAAAGNTGSKTEQFPAASHDVVAVGALSADGSGLAAFSGSGGWVDVAAPGEQVAGPVPGGGYAWWDGTSVATPFVAGQLALLRSQRQAEHADKLVERVEKTARRLEPRGRPKTDAIDIVGSLGP